jgi:dimethylaniline monooxygenase (N-oxide forming)
MILGEGSVMKSTILNTSKELSGYSDFPPPKEAANFMRNADVLDYIRTYCDHFDVLKYIRFEHAIVGIERADDYDQSGQWLVRWTTNATKYQLLTICHILTEYLVIVANSQQYSMR